MSKSIERNTLRSPDFETSLEIQDGPSPAGQFTGILTKNRILDGNFTFLKSLEFDFEFEAA